MLKLLRITATLGLAFGLIFSFIIYAGGSLFPPVFLLIIPLGSALLSSLGGLIGAGINNYLVARSFADARTRQMIAFICAALVNILIVFAILAYTGRQLFGVNVFLSMVLGTGMGAAYAVYRFRLERLNERMAFLQELAEKNRRLQEASRRLAITEERNRMGRELHDSVSQGLHGLVFSIHSLRNALKDPPPQVAAIIDHMEATAGATLAELKALIEELKPCVLAEQGLAGALKTAAEMLSQRQEIPVETELEIPEPLPPQLETAVYRICQEALTNIEKHAGASRVIIRLSREDDHLLLTVRDDGRGFTGGTPPSGNGLKNMRQRAEELGGTLHIIGKPGLGTSVMASFPLKG